MVDGSLHDAQVFVRDGRHLLMDWDDRACGAVNGHVPGDDKSTVARLRMFLDGRP